MWVCTQKGLQGRERGEEGEREEERERQRWRQRDREREREREYKRNLGILIQQRRGNGTEVVVKATLGMVWFCTPTSLTQPNWNLFSNRTRYKTWKEEVEPTKQDSTWRNQEITLKDDYGPY